MALSGPALLDLMRAVLAKGAAFRFAARGWSMAPFVRDGDVIAVAPLGGRRPRLGEVVAFVRPGSERLVVHRVIARRAGGCLIRGDNTLDGDDGLVPLSDVLGRVTRVERGGRQVRLGLGGERIPIALLSRFGMLVGLRARLGSLRRRVRRA